MPKKGANISLSSYDDIFETDESRAGVALITSWNGSRRSLSAN